MRNFEVTRVVRNETWNNNQIGIWVGVQLMYVFDVCDSVGRYILHDCSTYHQVERYGKPLGWVKVGFLLAIHMGMKRRMCRYFATAINQPQIEREPAAAEATGLTKPVRDFASL